MSMKNCKYRKLVMVNDLADGKHSNIDIAYKSNLSLEEINNAISNFLSRSLISIK